jgi:hypothetical protein
MKAEIREKIRTARERSLEKKLRTPTFGPLCHAEAPDRYCARCRHRLYVRAWREKRKAA